jgi:hypothetical protein
LHSIAISSDEVEIPVRTMISFLRFRVAVIVQISRIFPRAVQLLQAVSLLLGGRDQLLRLDLQLK